MRTTELAGLCFAVNIIGSTPHQLSVLRPRTRRAVDRTANKPISCFSCAFISSGSKGDSKPKGADKEEMFACDNSSHRLLTSSNYECDCQMLSAKVATAAQSFSVRCYRTSAAARIIQSIEFDGVEFVCGLRSKHSISGLIESQRLTSTSHCALALGTHLILTFSPPLSISYGQLI